MGGSSSSSKDETKTKRYAPYIETRHVAFLDTTTSVRESIINDSPYDKYVGIDATAPFFGAGVVLESASSVFATFDEFMRNLDLVALWDNTFTKVLTRSEIDENTAEKIRTVDEELVVGGLADFQVRMRNLNAVSSSSFVIGKSVLENKRVKALMAISLSAKEEVLPAIPGSFAAELNWNANVVKRYAEVMKSYFSGKMDSDDAEYTVRSKTALWPFTVLSFEGAALATMQSTVSWRKVMDPRERSTVSGLLLVSSYGVSGAYTGFSIGGPVGAIVGAVVGIIIGIAMWLFE